MPINKYEEPRQFLPKCALDRCTTTHPDTVLYHIDYGDLHLYMCKPHALMAGAIGMELLINEEDSDMVRAAVNELAGSMSDGLDGNDWDMAPHANRGIVASAQMPDELAFLTIEAIAKEVDIVAIQLNRDDLPFGANDPLEPDGDSDYSRYQMPHPSDEQIENEYR